MLGLPVSHRDVAGLARGIYGTYARFAIEVMRLPGLPSDEPMRLMTREGEHHDRFLALCRQCQQEGRGIIAVSGHIGSIEVFAGAYAGEGLPTYGLADDSAFPELFELLNQSRARWGVTIIPWKKLREIFRVMRTAGHPGHGRGLGLPLGRPAGEALRLLDHAAGRTGHAGGTDRGGHRAGRRPPPRGRPIRAHHVRPDRGH